MLKFALVGCGRIAKRHSELLGSQQIENASLVAVCDLDSSKCSLIGNQFNIPYFTDMHQMMETIDIDVVVVLTESGNHSNNVIELSHYGKHIVVEKPMALSLSEADKMISACEKKNIRLFVVKQNRFNVPVIKLKNALDEGRFGKLILGTTRVRWCRPQEYYDQADWRGTWALDGGVLTNQASHHIDLLEWMMGDIESVSAFGATLLAKIETEDTAVVNVKFKSGALGIIEATTATRPKDLEGSLSILGEGGTVEIGGFAVNEMKIWNFVDKREDDKNILKNYSVNPPNVYGFGHKAYYDHVVKNLIDNKRNQIVDGYEGRKSLELIYAIYESIEKKKLVEYSSKSNECRLGR